MGGWGEEGREGEKERGRACGGGGGDDLTHLLWLSLVQETTGGAQEACTVSLGSFDLQWREGRGSRKNADAAGQPEKRCARLERSVLGWSAAPPHATTLRRTFRSDKFGRRSARYNRYLFRLGVP